MKTITLRSKNDSLDITSFIMGHNSEGGDAHYSFSVPSFDRYLDAGGNSFDTARIYGEGECERWLGDYLRGKRRDSFNVITKCGHHDRGNPPRGRLEREILVKELDTSLSLLGLDYVDVLFLHRDDVAKPVEEIMPVLADFVKAGKVRFIGASNWTAGRIAEANLFAEKNGLPGFSVSQICWSLALTTSARSGDTTHVIMDMAEYLWYKQSGMPVMSWTPSARGFLSKLASGAAVTQRVESWFGYLGENRERAQRAKSLADELNVPVGAVVLAWLLSNTDFPTAAVASFSTSAQLEEDILATQLTLTSEQRGYLSGGLPV